MGLKVALFFAYPLPSKQRQHLEQHPTATHLLNLQKINSLRWHKNMQVSQNVNSSGMQSKIWTPCHLGETTKHQPKLKLKKTKVGKLFIVNAKGRSKAPTPFQKRLRRILTKKPLCPTHNVLTTYPPPRHQTRYPIIITEPKHCPSRENLPTFQEAIQVKLQLRLQTSQQISKLSQTPKCLKVRMCTWQMRLRHVGYSYPVEATTY